MATSMEPGNVEILKQRIAVCKEQLLKRCKSTTGGDNTNYADCEKRCSSVLDKLTADVSGEQIQQLLQQFSPVILDYTFIDENILVDEDFPLSTSNESIQSILSELDSIVSLAKDVLPNHKVTDSLGEEIVECVYWRKGALLYMFCKTIESNKERIANNIDQYKQYLVNGVENLQQMLEVRKSVNETRDDVITNNEDVFNLIKSGIYSDTHMLALVYAGEMCYWLDECVRQGMFQVDSVDYKRIGNDFLKLYVQIVNGPFKSQGWNTEQAETMLKSLTS